MGVVIAFFVGIIVGAVLGVIILIIVKTNREDEIRGCEDVHKEIDIKEDAECRIQDQRSIHRQ